VRNASPDGHNPGSHHASEKALPRLPDLRARHFTHLALPGLGDLSPQFDHPLTGVIVPFITNGSSDIIDEREVRYEERNVGGLW